MSVTEPPDRLLLARALAGIGLPEPTRIAPVGRPWRHANWRVGFAPDAEQADVLVRIPVHPEVGDTLSPEVAALTALEGSGLPVVRQYARLRGLGRPAAVSEPLPGRTGEAVMRADPAQGALVTSAVGEVMRRLSEVRLQGFGTRAMGNRFVPMRPTWTEEWTARIAAFRTVVMASGIHLGSLSRALDEAIDARLGALSSVVDFSLVHGDLQPGNLLFEVGPDGPRLSGVIDWEGALAGDPFVDWALPLLVTDETLGHVVSGLGSEAVEQALAEPAAAARIELYHLTHLLHRLAFAAGPHLRGDRSRQGAAVEQVRGMLVRYLEGEGVEERLRGALSRGGGVVSPLRRPEASAVLRRRLLAALGRGEVDGPGAAWTWTGAASAVRVAGQAPVGGGAWLDRASELLARLPERRWVGSDPIADRAVWLADRVRRVIGASGGASGPATALAFLASAVEVLDAVDWTVGDPVLRGLEGAVEGLVSLGAGWRDGVRPAASVRLAHGLIGLWALRTLVAHVADGDGDPGFLALRGAFAKQTGQAWEGLGLQPTSGEVLDLFDAGPPSVRPEAEPALTSVLCGAVAGLDRGDALPVPAMGIFRALGLAPAP